MNYQNGTRTFFRYDEMSPLDRALEKYERQAKDFFDLSNKAESDPDIRKKRNMELSHIKKHLENEKRLVMVSADIQAGLDAYRDYGRGAVESSEQSRLAALSRRKELLEEDHHPTDILEKYMRAVPNPKPSSQHTAHHIAPGKGKTKFAYRARVKLATAGIRINDPDNGVWLPYKASYTPHWSMPQALGHLQYHTNGYEQWVSEKLETKFGEVFLRQELRIIGQLMQENKLPQEVRKK
jgi:hypothetical protein